jgi:hypothetical protein
MRLTTKHLMRTPIRKTDLNPGLDKPRQEKNYEMCESRAEIKQDDIEVF